MSIHPLKAINEIELKYTWTIPADAWYVRFYLWLWEAEKKDVTFCKLFWGYVFTIPALCLRAMLGLLLVVLMGALLAKDGVCVVGRAASKATAPSPSEIKQREKKAEERRAKDEQKALARKENPPPMLRVLNAIAYGAVRTGMSVQTAGFFLKNISAPFAVPLVKSIARGAVAVFMATVTVLYWIFRGIEWITDHGLIPSVNWGIKRVLSPLYKPGTILAGLAGVVLVAAALPAIVMFGGVLAVSAAGLGIWRLSKISERMASRICLATILSASLISLITFVVTLFTSLRFSFFYTLATFAGAMAVTGIGFIVAWFWSKLLERYCPRFFDWLLYGPPAVPAKYATMGISKTGATFGEIMWMGLKAVKSNTCPRIVIEDENEKKGDDLSPEGLEPVASAVGGIVKLETEGTLR